jgi:hypothetical protein
MTYKRSIKIKAATLLTVFALNTVIAFACSVGLKMGYNDQHHHEEKKEEKSHTHSHGHSHDVGANHHENPAGSHHHDKGTAAHHHEEDKPTEDDCCTGSAIKFQAEDKKLQQSQNIQVKVPVFVSLLSAFYGLEIAPLETITATSKLIIPQYYPPPDIRIVIQSFQI